VRRPIVEEQLERVAAPVPTSRSERGLLPAPRPPARILVADDDDTFRGALGDALAQAGYEVVEVADGDAALETLAAAADGLAPAPDVVVLDVMMPGYSGLGILKVMRRFAQPPPTLLVTAFADRSLDVLAKNLGAIDVLRKPVAIDDVLCAVLEAAKRRQHHDDRQVRSVRG
jgi:DNA-binding response OmpR family regulator